MFSYIPYSFHPQSSYSYNRSRSYTPAASPYTYARALAEERNLAARRAATEQEARDRFARYQEDDDEDDYDGYRYSRGYTPRQRAYLEAQRRQQAAEGERAREERKRREVEDRVRREQEVRQEFYCNGLRAPGATQKTDEPVSSPRSPDQDLRLTHDTQNHASERTSRTPSPARSVPSSMPSDSTFLTPNPPTPIPTAQAIPTAQTNTLDTDYQPKAPSLPMPEQTAAAKIQSFYRTRKALATISELEAKFGDLKHAFTLPEAVDYLSADGEVITVKVDASVIPMQLEAPSESTLPARLAFTPANVPIRAYDEDLNRILTKLDAVESWGQKKVRERRRDVVRNVELEAARIETVWAEVWRRHISAEKADEEEEEEEEEVKAVLVNVPDVVSAPTDAESTEMTVDPPLTPASVEHLSSAAESATGTPSDDTAQGTFMMIPSPSLPSEVSTTPFRAESRSIDEAVDNQPNLPSTPTLDAGDTCSKDGAAGETSGSDSDMESGDSDYESVGSVSEASEDQDQKDDGMIRMVWAPKRMSTL